MLQKCIAIALIGIIALSCNTHNAEPPDIVRALNPVEQLSLIPGGDNATITVNRGSDSYMLVEIDGIENNDFAQLGKLEAWCIDWRKPLDLSNGVYSGVKIYSTFNVEKWAKLNYLINILDELRDEDPTITFREIQTAIWTLRTNPEFDIDSITLDDLPTILVEDGRTNFNYLKVEEILQKVEMNYNTFELEEGSKYALVLETPADTQTIFAVIE